MKFRSTGVSCFSSLLVYSSSLFWPTFNLLGLKTLLHERDGLKIYVITFQLGLVSKAKPCSILFNIKILLRSALILVLVKAFFNNISWYLLIWSWKIFYKDLISLWKQVIFFKLSYNICWFQYTLYYGILKIMIFLIVRGIPIILYIWAHCWQNLCTNFGAPT